MKEIDKILAIKGKLDKKQQNEVDTALESVNQLFKEFILSSKDYMLDEKKEKPDCKKAKEALDFIKSCANTVNEEFPEFNNEEEVITFVLKYGSEIVNL